MLWQKTLALNMAATPTSETYSARGQIENSVAVGMPEEEPLIDGVSENF